MHGVAQTCLHHPAISAAGCGGAGKGCPACTAGHSCTSAVEDIARLTQETGETFGRVEEAFDEMDSRVESMGTTLQHSAKSTDRTVKTHASNLAGSCNFGTAIVVG